MNTQGDTVSEKDPAPAKESPWTSLEVAKILVSAATPLAVFALGWVVTQSDRAERSAREQQSELRAGLRDKAVREEARRDSAFVRAEARKDGEQARRETFQRQAELEEQAFARDVVLKRETDLREGLRRREAADEARRNRILDRRLEVWARAGPELARLEQLIDPLLQEFSIRPRRNSSDIAQRAETHLENYIGLIEPFHSIFSPEFARANRRYTGDIRYLLMRADPPERVLQRANEIHTRYRELLDTVRTDLTSVR